jgi:hypothetical protein
MLSASCFHNKQQSPQKRPSTQALEDVSWDCYMFKITTVLPNAATAPPSIKERYYPGVLKGSVGLEENECSGFTI